MGKMFSSLALALLLCGLPTPAAKAVERRLVISTLPFDDARQQEAVFAKLGELLGARLGRAVRFEAGESYEEVLARLAAGKTDVAFLGAASYVEARRRGEVRAVLRAVRHKSSTYRGVILVKKTSPVRSLAQLRGQAVGFVDRRSTAGWILPRELLRTSGLDAERDLAPQFLGKHSAVVDAVLAGTVAAGAVFEGAEEASRAPQELRVLAKTAAAPGDPVVVRPGLGAELVRELRSAMVELATLPEARAFLTYAEIDGFVPATDADYDEVAKLVQEQAAPR